MIRIQNFLPVTIIFFLANSANIYGQKETSETLVSEIQTITDMWRKLVEQNVANTGTITCNVNSDNERLVAKGRGVLLREPGICVWYVGDSASECTVAMVSNLESAFQVGLTERGERAIFQYRDFSRGELPYSSLEFRNATLGANAGFLTFPPLLCGLHELSALLPFARIHDVSENDAVRTFRINLDQRLMKEKLLAKVGDLSKANPEERQKVSAQRDLKVIGTSLSFGLSRLDITVQRKKPFLPF